MLFFADTFLKPMQSSKDLANNINIISSNCLLQYIFPYTFLKTRQSSESKIIFKVISFNFLHIYICMCAKCEEKRKILDYFHNYYY